MMFGRAASQNFSGVPKKMVMSEPQNRNGRTFLLSSFSAGFMLVSQDTGIGQPDYGVSHLFPLESGDG